MPTTTEFVSFAVKPGMEATAEEWLEMLVERQVECVATLDRERMRYESVFKTRRDGRLYLSWFSVRGQGGEGVHSSPLAVDRLHLEYWSKCIDPSMPPEIQQHVVSFVPSEVAAAIEPPDAL